MSGLDLDAYLARIGASALSSPTLSEPHRAHLVLGVEAGDLTWLADVGFGPGSLLSRSRSDPPGPTSSPAGCCAALRSTAS
jgi:arylamine N-acetyltransferase